MKRLTKILSIVMIITMLVMAISPVLFATGSAIDPDTITPNYGNSGGKLSNIGSKVLGILTNIGIVLSVVIIAGLGIKYIVGSAEEKNEKKKSFVPLLVGMILLFGASAIAKFIVSIASSAT